MGNSSSNMKHFSIAAGSGKNTILTPTEKPLLAKLLDNINRDTPEDNPEYACIICMERKRRVVFLDCTHMLTCVQCSIKLFINNEADISMSPCPLCRQTIRQGIVTW